MKFLKQVILLLILVLSISSNIEAVEVTFYGKYNGKEVKLRWLPEDKNLRYSYKLYRSDKANKNSKLIVSLQKMKGKDAEAFLPKEYAGVKDFLYPLSNVKTKDEKRNIIMQAQQIIDFQLLMADHDIKFARVLGIGYEDKNFKTNKHYIYTLKVFSKDGKAIGEKQLFMSTDKPSFISPVDSIKVSSKGFGVGVRWKYFDQYSAYNIYRSTSINGKYKKINKQPVSINYKVNKHGVVQAPPYFFIDDTLQNYKLHYYRVSGVDFFGDESVLSLVGSAKKLRPILKPLETKKANLDVNENKVVITWDEEPSKKIEFYNVFRSFEFDKGFKILNKKPLKKRTFTDANVTENASYFYRVDGFSKNGIVTMSIPTLAIPWDNTAPSQPKGIKAKIEAGKVSLSWTKVKDKSFLGYKVFRSMDLKDNRWYMLQSGLIKDEYTVDVLPKEQDKKYYYYKVLALDKNQNISEPSEILKVILPDVTAPRRPTITSSEIKEKGFLINWKKSTSKDVFGYNVYKKQDEKAIKLNKKPLTVLSYIDNNLQAGKQVSYAITAIDKANNESESTDWISLKYRDKIAPKIGAFSAVKKSKSIVITFDSKDKDLDGFRVYRSNDSKSYEQYSKYIKGVNNFTDTRVNITKTYFYYIVLYDTSGNRVTSKTLTVK